MLKQFWGNPDEVEEVPKEKTRDQEIFVKEPAILEIVDNRIYFYAEIGRTQILKLNRELRCMNNTHVSRAQIQEDDHLTPIYLHINSYGGSIFCGLAGLDEIRKTKVPVMTIVDGCCASAATFLSVVGKKRYINRHSFMMIHQLSSFFWGKYGEFEDEKQNLDRLMETIKQIYNEFTEVPNETIEEILKHDLWFDADKCLKYGLVDEIL